MNIKNKAIYLCLLLTGCTNYQAESFSTNSIDVYNIQNLFHTPIGISEFSATDPEQNSIFCRGIKHSVYLPNKITFKKYIEDAFRETLINASLYDKNSPYKLRGKIDLVDFNTTSGSWHLKGLFTLNNSVPVMIDKRYEFPSAWDNDIACQNTASALSNAVSSFVKDIMTNENIKNAIKYKTKT